MEVTARNGGPWSSSFVIPIEPPGGPVAYLSHKVDDTAGGVNQVIPGQKARLRIELINNGTSLASDVKAKLTTEDKDITITSSSASYGTIPAEGTKSSDFFFTVSSDAVPHEVSFSLEVTARNGGPWSDSFVIPIKPPGGPVAYLSYKLDDTEDGDGDERAEAGERVKLSVTLINNGSVAALGTTAYLSTEDKDIKIRDRYTSYEDIEPGGNSFPTNAWDAFEIEVLNQATEHEAEFTLEITADNGGPWESSFKVPIHEHPGPPGPVEFVGYKIYEYNHQGILGLPEPGEEIGLGITLINRGTAPALDVEAELSTDDKGIEISRGTVRYGAVLPGVGKYTQEYHLIFGFVVSKDSAPHDITFKLKVSCSIGGPWESTFTIPAVAFNTDVEPYRLWADGKSTSQISARLKDIHGNSIHDEVIMEIIQGPGTISAVSGDYHATYTASNEVGEAFIAITAKRLNITSVETIRLLPPGTTDRLGIRGVLYEKPGMRASGEYIIEVKNTSGYRPPAETRHRGGYDIYIRAPKGNVVAKIGDELVVTVYDTQRNFLTSRKHILTMDEVSKGRVEGLDILLSYEGPPPGPVVYFGHKISDGGDKDGIPEAGEGIGLAIALINNGDGEAIDVEAYLSTDDGDVAIKESPYSIQESFVGHGRYGDLAPGEVKYESSPRWIYHPYAFRVLEGSTPHDITFNLRVTALNSDTSWESTFTIPSVSFSSVAQPDHLPADGESTSAISVNITDANGVPITDEVVTMKIIRGPGEISSVTSQGGAYSATYTTSDEVGMTVIAVTATKLNISSVEIIRALLPGTTDYLNISGTLYQTPGVVASEKYKVEVRNANKDDTSWDSYLNDGRYSVSFRAWGDTDVVAETGDVLEITVMKHREDEALIQKQHTLTENEIRSGSVTLDIILSEEVGYPAWDVNQNGVVDIFDLVIVGKRFGEKITTPLEHNPDVNGDGVVDISDLALVGKHFGEDYRQSPGAPLALESTATAKYKAQIELTARKIAAGAPLQVDVRIDSATDLYGYQFDLRFNPNVLEAIEVVEGTMLRRDNIRTHWRSPKIDNAAGKIIGVVSSRMTVDEGANSSGVLATIHFKIKDANLMEQSPIELENVKLADVNAHPISSTISSATLNWEELFLPSNFKLLQNYPNPFNPETWIPYQLAESSQVTISIYNVTGQLIRTLETGYKDAGIYHSKQRAAYWDGQNEAGEHVASGVYFYQLQAGKFRAIKKLLVLK